MKIMTRIACCMAVLFAAGPVFADPITGLFNTGVDGSGNPLLDGTIGDPHYVLSSVPGGTPAIRVRTSAGGYPVPPYIGDNTTSAWIGPNNTTQVDGPVGPYTYRTSFDLTGMDPNTANIAGGWSTDNDGVKILLNGADTGNLPTSGGQFSIGFAAFIISSGFQAGVNTLDFIVNNGGGPTGLRVEMTGSVRAANTAPDAGSTLALLGGAFTMLGALGRKFRK